MNQISHCAFHIRVHGSAALARSRTSLRIFIPSFSAAITFSSRRICVDRITSPCCFCAVICSATSSGRKRFTGSGLVKNLLGVCSAPWLFSVQRKSNQNDNGATRWRPAHIGTQGATTDSPRSPVLREASADPIRLCVARIDLRFPLLAHPGPLTWALHSPRSDGKPTLRRRWRFTRAAAALGSRLCRAVIMAGGFRAAWPSPITARGARSAGRRSAGRVRRRRPPSPNPPAGTSRPLLPASRPCRRRRH